MKITFIRHGKTIGNEKKVYIGLTDESLSDIGRKFIENNKLNNIYPDCQFVYSSPLKRCLETKDIIYPYQKYKIIDTLTECNFGDYEYKSYEDLKNYPEYQSWIYSGGLGAFPNGESGIDFRKRSVKAFEEIIADAEKNEFSQISIICHGGNIMAIMEHFEESRKTFYEWQIKNGQYINAELSHINKNISLNYVSKI